MKGFYKTSGACVIYDIDQRQFRWSYMVIYYGLGGGDKIKISRIFYGTYRGDLVTK